MARRKLLLVTYHFPPSAASATFRVLGFVRHLPRYGWEAVVVAPPRGLWEPVDDELVAQVPPGTVVYRVPHPQGPLARLTRRLSPGAPWILPAFAACARAIREHHPSAVLTTSPPHSAQLLGCALKLRYRLPWLADFRDPWVATARRAAERSLGARCEALLEQHVLRAADVVIANAPNARAGLQAAYPDCRDKVISLTNGYDPERFEPPLAIKRTGEIVILHAGEVYGGRDPRPLLDAVGGLVRAPLNGRPVRLTFLGQVTDRRCDLPAEVGRRGLATAVSVEAQAGYRESLERMAAADILLLLDSPGRRVGVPAKLYEYLGAGRPVLALAEPDGDTAWVLRESGTLHRTAPADDPARIERALRELVALASERSACVPAGASAFTREHLARDLAGILDACLAPAPAPVRAAFTLRGEGEPAR
jgi:glycosyltransferase involved in cell wall biosynthesis